ncbi:MAG: hypothetical protein ACREHG_03555, partial [Candidatus Saccharimonadales bacterium]
GSRLYLAYLKGGKIMFATTEFNPEALFAQKNPELWLTLAGIMMCSYPSTQRIGKAQTLKKTPYPKKILQGCVVLPKQPPAQLPATIPA